MPKSAAGPPVITVLLVDDHLIVRDGLRMLLEASGETKIVGEADNGLDAVTKARELRPDVVVLDLEMPRLNGVEAARQITRHVPKTKILVLSTHSDAEIVRDLIGAGISGYLTKDVASTQVLDAVRETARGNTYFTPAITRHVLDQSRSILGKQGPTPRVALTSREMEVLQLVAEGHANKQVADLLAISIKTVEKHRQSLMRKLDIHETATLTRYAVSRSIVHCHPVSAQ
jgi:DNA-binding NarL/FixJ family response regulator